MVAKGKQRQASPPSERDVAEAAKRGGLVALVDGPANCHWYFRDWFLQQDPASWRRVGYVETQERRENPNPELRGYGTAMVWRYDPALVPDELAEVTPPAPRRAGPLPCSKCGQRKVGPGGILCPECVAALSSWTWGESRAA